MVRKETCPECRGNRYVKVEHASGKDLHRKCPSCDGTGYRIRISPHFRDRHAY